jgi:anthranilate phosphoribosyltransferase
VAQSVHEGLKRAQEALASGDAKKKLDELVAATSSS